MSHVTTDRPHEPLHLPCPPSLQLELQGSACCQRHRRRTLNSEVAPTGYSLPIICSSAATFGRRDDELVLASAFDQVAYHKYFWIRLTSYSLIHTDPSIDRTIVARPPRRLRHYGQYASFLAFVSSPSPPPARDLPVRRDFGDSLNLFHLARPRQERLTHGFTRFGSRAHVDVQRYARRCPPLDIKTMTRMILVKLCEYPPVLKSTFRLICTSPLRFCGAQFVLRVLGPYRRDASPVLLCLHPQ